MQIIRGIIPSAQKVLVYGPEGIGKSTFVSQFPDPIFIDTEGSTKHMNVARTPKPSSFQILLEQVTYFRDNPNELKTLVIDTADWAEKLCSENLCAKNKKKSIEDFGYGKGYVYLMEEFGGLLNLLDELIERNINVVMTAHAKMRKFEQPDEMGAYDRWELKLSKQVAPLLKEWADMVLFANYKTYVVNVDGQGAEKGKNKAQGGTRVMYTTHHPCWDAKNRHNLPSETKFSYEEIAHIFQGNASCSTEKVVESKCENVVQNPIEQSLPERKENVMPEFMTQEQMPVEVQSNQETVSPDRSSFDSNPEHLPKALLDLMKEHNVNEWHIQSAVAARGYYPENTPIERYDPEFIQGVLVGAWPQVYEMIKEIKEKEEIPFSE